MNVYCKQQLAVGAAFSHYQTQYFTRDFQCYRYNLMHVTETYQVTDIHLQKALNYIREHFRNQIEHKEVARMAGLTPSSLSKLFKKMTCLTFTQILNEVRIAHSVKLIWTANENMETIAYDCGFGTGRTFTREFRMCTGYTPVDFRTLCRRCIVSEEERKEGALSMDETAGYTQAGNENNHYRSSIL